LNSKNFLKYHFPFILWLLIIFVQSSLAAIELPKIDIISTDKLIHMGVFGLLAGLCYISLIHIYKTNIFSANPLIWAAIITILYGASDEIHQYFVPNRSSEVLDWMADAMGALIAVLIIKYFLQKRYTLFKKRALVNEP
jgi:VanZ family protein